ncbi:hypothetical protein GALMADRAFT_592178 [Galerina marginata CBS 339.88]|uniref:Uncharacterized protein n=1 Tax=Galerina marginata (strain CBS 339.88) TaxID=685588 RepID=A0A067T1L3_GALM3|nr:hypothetical protein GALMADRAFT_592178 [Galerina marginata CBS 339.88]
MMVAALRKRRNTRTIKGDRQGTNRGGKKFKYPLLLILSVQATEQRTLMFVISCSFSRSPSRYPCPLLYNSCF